MQACTYIVVVAANTMQHGSYAAQVGRADVKRQAFAQAGPQGVPEG